MYQGAEPASVVSAGYSFSEVLVGILNEGLRAGLLCYLFPHIKGAGSSYLHAIKFNLIIVGLIGSLWIIAGYGMFVLKNPGLFLVEDTIILLLQGVTSGICLQVLYKKQFLENSKT
jgi:hypothetical protein